MNMSSINNNNNINSVETVNAAATAIVSAESRVQPTSVQKRRWGGCWSLYSCFGSYKHSKQISHALLAPESAPSGPAPSSLTQNPNNSNAIIFPFIAPPSSPASFLQSDPPSASYSPVGLLSFKSLSQNPNSQGVPSSIFTVGPYAYETQLVSPPVFSTYTTEPSTASFTPPPESVHATTPSSPEVPFAQLLTSSLARARRHSMGSNQKFPFSQYEFQPYTGSPGGSVLSPGSTIPNSGTSSPFPDKQPRVLKLRVGDDPKFIGYEYFSTRKWGSRLGSESATPNGVSGSATPHGYGLGSRVGSGSLTPNGGGEMYLMESQISEVASLANSATSSPKGETLVDHRVSFDLTHLDVMSGAANNLEASFRTSSGRKTVSNKTDNLCEYCVNKKNSSEILEAPKEKECQCKRASVSRDFNFDNTNGVELGSQNNWTFFPMLQPEVKPS
ncbi:hypothetical protein M8C21_015409 [Ambrosia artemisiifolia]|uniref:Hydroxyproline-rich glycoprotein family protein n=1 Tax=Ambrosia artemisiifolia TaxID=4212 RepID=A0AAD5C5T1_AMBAR|nr:hypothetical protein M8C21_015409 [Ambrosia artemisiifolia]